ncbi:MAG TPA: hypothetical protein VMO26_04895 [Vicinamibacterales bacterium]|nr:hypothetical protein [Vicinamibacterales bacterium]
MRAYASGDRVNHSQYGDGTIDSVNEYHTKITFDQHGLRTFQSSRVVLTRATTTAPSKPVTRRRRAAAIAQ